MRIGLAGVAACLWLTAGHPAVAPPAPAPLSARAQTRDTSWVARGAIYEVNVRAFSPAGDFQGVLDGLDRIQATGADVLWLMPIHPVGVANRKGPLGSPYSVRDYHAIDSAYGTPADFRKLIRAVHARGMKVILDWVPNHTAWDHVWVGEHPDFYVRDERGGLTVPRDDQGRPTDWTDVAELDYRNPGLRRAMIAAMRHWLVEFGIDGLRVDVAGFVPDDFWREALPALRSAAPGRILLLAEWGDLKMHRLGFDLTYAWDTYHRLKAVWRGAPADTLVRSELADLRAMPPGGLRLRFTTNHDETAWDQPPVTLFGGAAGARAAFVAMALLPGRPLMYNGQEVESPQKLGLFVRDAIAWDQPRAAAARAFYQGVLHLARTDSTFIAGDLRELETSAPDQVIAYRRGGTVVLVNARPGEVRVGVTGVEVDRARDLLSDSIQRGDTVALPAYGARVLRPASIGGDVSPDQRAVAPPVGGCRREAAVTVHVVNQSSMDIGISFGQYRAARAADGFSRTTYRVARVYLQSPIQLRIVRGGLEVGTPPPIQTESVVCNDATLIIGARPNMSFFYGDLVRSPSGRGRDPSGQPLRPDSATGCCTVTIRALVPEGTGTVYLTGNLAALGPWHPDGLAMAGTGRERTARVTAASGTTFEYKFTLGSWDREALDSAGRVPPNSRLAIDRDVEAVHEISHFKKDPREYIADWTGSGVVGRLVYWTDVRSAYLGPTRHVEIWLPPGYDKTPSARYPVLYMADGQNLFDPRIASTGVDWGVDESVVRLVQRGTIPPVIVVGVWNTADRGPEYSPWHRATDYARFLIEELMPRVNADFRTLTGPEHTAVMGSSMGGLLSFYLVTHHSAVFGACGCVSTHFPLSEKVVGTYFPGLAGGGTPDTTPYVIRDIAAGLTVPPGARYWFDYGTRGLDADYGPTHGAVRGWLLAQGLVEGEDFVVRRYEGADHNEAAWRARLDDPLTFLFGPARR